MRILILALLIAHLCLDSHILGAQALNLYRAKKHLDDVEVLIPRDVTVNITSNLTTVAPDFQTTTVNSTANYSTNSPVVTKNATATAMFTVVIVVIVLLFSSLLYYMFFGHKETETEEVISRDFPKLEARKSVTAPSQDTPNVSNTNKPPEAQLVVGTTQSNSNLISTTKSANETIAAKDQTAPKSISGLQSVIKQAKDTVTEVSKDLGSNKALVESTTTTQRGPKSTRLAAKSSLKPSRRSRIEKAKSKKSKSSKTPRSPGVRPMAMSMNK